MSEGMEEGIWASLPERKTKKSVGKNFSARELSTKLSLCCLYPQTGLLKG
jgi:hypothetical protein